MVSPNSNKVEKIIKIQLLTIKKATILFH